MFNAEDDGRMNAFKTNSMFAAENALNEQGEQEKIAIEEHEEAIIEKLQAMITEYTPIPMFPVKI